MSHECGRRALDLGARSAFGSANDHRNARTPRVSTSVLLGSTPRREQDLDVQVHGNYRAKG